MVSCEFFEKLVCSSGWLNICVQSCDSIRLLFLLMSAGSVATAIVSSLMLVVFFFFFLFLLCQFLLQNYRFVHFIDHFIKQILCFIDTSLFSVFIYYFLLGFILLFLFLFFLRFLRVVAQIINLSLFLFPSVCIYYCECPFQHFITLPHKFGCVVCSYSFNLMFILISLEISL